MWEPWGRYPGSQGDRPEVGDIVCSEDAVPRRVTAVEERHYANWPDDALIAFEDVEETDPEKWEQRPMVMYTEVASDSHEEDHQDLYTRPWSEEPGWWKLLPVWPECCVCRLVMPCNHYITEHQVAIAALQLDSYEGIEPGLCYYCEDLLEGSNHVVFPGENLLMLGAEAPGFHLAGKCREMAQDYMEKWSEHHKGEHPQNNLLKPWWQR